nr:hypothetical protein [Tanacetum cinerariifolium]GEZ81753.1 hypothetical protein [Tanacetum cinerariifolium]
NESSFFTKGAALEACLVNEGIALNDNTSVTESNGTESESNSLVTSFSRSEDEDKSYDKDSSILMNECSSLGNENASSGHESTDSGNDADADVGPSYDSDVVIEDRDKEKHANVAHEQQRDFFASLINNLKYDVRKCNEVNREAQQANALLINELESISKKKTILQKI